MRLPLSGLAIRDEHADGVVYRTCQKCGQRKALNAVNYYRSRAHFSGYDLVCKICRQAKYRKIYKERYAKDAENRRLTPCMLVRDDYNQRRQEVREDRRKREADNVPVKNIFDIDAVKFLMDRIVNQGIKSCESCDN
jgi:hypothetical protein